MTNWQSMADVLYYSVPTLKRGEARKYLYWNGAGWREEEFGLHKSIKRQKQYGKDLGRKPSA